jgi:Uma2 family endonuclease
VSESSTVEHELLTSEDFLGWLEPGSHADLIDGEIFMHPPVSIPHADLLNFLDRVMAGYIEQFDLGVLYREVVAVRLSSRNTFLPDLAYFRKDRRHVVEESYVDGAPEMVVEALSPRTASRDTGPKFAEYEQHGVEEYWILDPATLAHRFYRREGELLVEFAQEAARIESQVLAGFFVVRDWLDPTRLPQARTALATILAEGGRR